MKAGNTTYREPGDIPSIIPLFPLPSILLLPRGQLPLNIFEPRYLKMIDATLGGERLIGVIQPKQDLKEDESDENQPLFSIGCVGRITKFQETGEDRYLVTLTGISRFRILDEVPNVNSYRMARVTAQEFQDDFASGLNDENVDRQKLEETLRKFLDMKGLELNWEDMVSVPTESLVNALSMMSPFETQEKQALLEASNLAERADTLIAITEIELAKCRGKGSYTLQ